MMKLSIPRRDFFDELFWILQKRTCTTREKKLLQKILIVINLTIQHEPPSVFIPKTIASTTKNPRFAVINGLAGGLLSFGTAHLGAIYDIMNIYSELINENNKDIIKNIEEMIKERGIFPGFGHPVYKKGHPLYKADPRPSLLIKDIKDQFSKSQYLTNYINLTKIFHEKGIEPNIDAISGLGYICLGFRAEHGVYLTFLARSLQMMQHICAELKEKKPFTFFLEHST